MAHDRNDHRCLAPTDCHSSSAGQRVSSCDSPGGDHAAPRNRPLGIQQSKRAGDGNSRPPVCADHGYVAYLPTIRIAAEGRYGANTLTTRVEVGAGETMLDHSIIALYKMLGKLEDTPSQ